MSHTPPHSHAHHHPHEHHSHAPHSHSHAGDGRDHFYHAALRQIRQMASPGQDIGFLAEIAARLSTAQGAHHPNTRPCAVIMFLSDHGIAKNLVPKQDDSSSWLQSGFSPQISSILARRNQTDLRVVDMGAIDSLNSTPGKFQNRISSTARNSAQETALSIAQVKQAMKVGADCVSGYLQQGARTFVMGAGGADSRIGAAAIAAYILNRQGHEMVGSSDAISEQAGQLIDSALSLHRPAIINPVTLLAHVGGLQIAALVGAITAAAGHDSALLVDGFIGLASAAVASQLSDHVQPNLFASHITPLPGHAALLEHLQIHPLWNTNMMCDDLTGSMLALPLLDAAATLLDR